METVNGGMKVVVEEEEEDEPSWFRTILDFFFKIKKWRQHTYIVITG